MAVTDSDGDSATVSDRDATTTDDMDVDADTENDDADSPDSARFRAGDKVLALHSEVNYPARVQDVAFRGGEWKFYIHYVGWNKKYDEWVGMERLNEFSAQSGQEQQASNKKDGLEKISKSGVASQMKPKTSSGASGKKKKRKYKLHISELGKFINVQMPKSLRKHLVKQYESVNKSGKLIRLPRSPNVDGILKKYEEYWLMNGNTVADSAKEISNGLRGYFDKALPAMLLYKSEREQYQKAVANDIPASAVYGAEHLIRLFVKLPDILSYANIEKETLEELQQKLEDFLGFLEKNETVFFLPA